MTSHEQPVVDADILLSDGRRLAYAVWGDPHGAPVFLFHGARAHGSSDRVQPPQPRPGFA